SPRGGETILLVEDEESVRALTRKILERDGYKVIEATHPKAALEILEKEAPPVRLLLTDVVMPEMDGHELAARVTLLRPGVRVLLMSGYADRASSNPDWPLLQKPFTPDGLTRKVREMLDSTSPPPRSQ